MYICVICNAIFDSSAVGRQYYFSCTSDLSAVRQYSNTCNKCNNGNNSTVGDIVLLSRLSSGFSKAYMYRVNSDGVEYLTVLRTEIKDPMNKKPSNKFRKRNYSTFFFR